MASILDLPTELLETILLPLSRQSLSKLSRTNKAFRMCLTKQIYKSIDWFWEDDKDSPAFDLLLRTLVSNHELTSLIKTFRVHGGGITPRSEWEHAWVDKRWQWDRLPCDWRPPSSVRSLWTRKHPMSFSLDDLARVDRFVSGMFRPPPHFWMSEFERGNVDVVVALLVAKFSSIEQLDLGFGYLHRSHFLPAMLRHSVSHKDERYKFPKLQHVNLAFDVPKTALGFYSDIDLLRPFFFLPRVKSIATAFPEPVIFAWPGEYPNSKSLSTLVLLRSSITEDTLGRILACTPRLKHLTYDHCQLIGCDFPDKEIYSIDSGYSIPCCFVRCCRLNDVLAHVQDSLESLVLKIRIEQWDPSPVTYVFDSSWPAGLFGRLTTLQNMPNLTTLEAPWVFLFGWEPKGWGTDYHTALAKSLPPNVQSLVLRNDMRDFTSWKWTDEEMLHLVRHLLEGRNRQFNRLQHISFHYMWHFRDTWHDRSAEKLRALCTSGALECSIELEEDPGLFPRNEPPQRSSD